MCQQSLLEVQGVTHTVALSLQVALVVLVGYHFDGHVLHNLESVRLQSYTLCGVVGFLQRFRRASRILRLIG